MDKNELLCLMKERRSIRMFSDKEVSEESINELIEAARWAPSACNLQHWLFVSIRNDEKKKLIAERGKVQKQIIKAPVLLAVFCNMEASPEQYANVQSVAAATMNILLYAHSIGLGINWVCGFDYPEEVSKILNVPKKYKLTAILMVGYPKDNLKIIPPPRHAVKKILFNEIYDAKEDFPSTVNVRHWEFEQLATYQQAISRRGFKYEHINDDKINEIIKSVARNLSGKVLDFNSYSGLFLSKMQKLNKQVYGQFLTEPVSVAARMYNEELENKNFIYGLEIKEKDLDAITSFYRLEHIRNVPRLLRMFRTALKENGKLVIVTRNKYSWRGLLDFYQFKFKNNNKLSSRYTYGLHHMGPWRFFSKKKLTGLLKKNGYRIVKARGRFIFPYSEIVNTVTFKKKYKKFLPLMKVIKKIDIALEKLGIANVLGETLIIEAYKNGR